MNETRKVKTGLLLFSLALGTFMSALDSSVVNIANPMIKSYFQVSLGTVEWIITAYLLVVSSVLLFFGRLSDIFGHKKVYLTGFAVFTAGSLLCGFSVNIGMLIACRVFQALGAGMMFSTSGAIVTDNVPAEKRGKAFGMIAMAVAVALCAGPVVGGALAGIFGWQSIFFINIPVGIAGLMLAARFIPADEKKKAAPLDIPGSAMAFAALFLLLLPLDQLSEGMNPFALGGMFVAGIILVAVFILYERKAKYPMLNLGLFKNRIFSASIAAAVFNFMAQFIMVFLAPFYLQSIRLFSPVITGLLYMPMPIATLIAAPIAGALSDRFDTRILSSIGMGVMAVGLFMLSFLNITTSYGYIIASLAICGLGSGMFQTPNNTAVMGNAPQENRGTASGILATSRNVGMVMGVALSGALFFVLSGSGIPNGAVSTQEQNTFIYALHITYIVAAAIALLAMLASLMKGKKAKMAETRESAPEESATM